MKLALAGDAILNRRISHIADPRARRIFQLMQDADVSFLNCETLFHDYTGPEVYPSAEGGWTYMRSPPEVAGELAWLGVKLAATANNHSFDYSYGGLFQTRSALEAAGVVCAGTGRDLASARAPAFYDAPEGRVALVSMSSTSTKTSRAGRGRDGLPGRPGLNPLSYHFAGDAATIAQAVDLATRFGQWVAQIDERRWEVNPPGLHHTVTQYEIVDGASAGLVLDEDDVAGNLRSIREARAVADLVIVHVHNHEWDTTTNALNTPPDFMRRFARQAIEAGADVVCAQGCHSPLRGLELWDGKPIFYDPGDLFAMTTISRFPSDFYERHDPKRAAPRPEAGLQDALAARRAGYFNAVNPRGGYHADGAPTGFVPTLTYEGRKLVRLELHPFVHEQSSALLAGVPLAADATQARSVIDHVQRLSAPFGARIVENEGRFEVQLG